ncbi:hypothetical protein BDY17DRAFT_324696 [Neohortaea acidophila]|uniref:Uncharacterized protein n=1 Tax=Neohortaea acidophila TaxID=245834 RepID=A0A6A6PQN5_9PEZI|nr:uncharacterized protein BDY17DRAFT_324696 [Neohortaea acidophila]KAF2482410.1 hypothetical protein BDY17DRAFT_324696 [Neohortaea acidophila]
MPWHLVYCFDEPRPNTIRDSDKGKKGHHGNAKHKHAGALVKKGDNDKASSHGGHHVHAKKHNEPDLCGFKELKKALSDAKKEKEMVEQRMAKAQGYTEFKVWKREAEELDKKISWYRREAEQEFRKIVEED